MNEETLCLGVTDHVNEFESVDECLVDRLTRVLRRICRSKQVEGDEVRLQIENALAVLAKTGNTETALLFHETDHFRRLSWRVAQAINQRPLAQ